MTAQTGSVAGHPDQAAPSSSGSSNSAWSSLFSRPKDGASIASTTTTATKKPQTGRQRSEADAAAAAATNTEPANPDNSDLSCSGEQPDEEANTDTKTGTTTTTANAKARGSNGKTHVAARTMKFGPLRLSVQTVDDFTLAAWIMKDLSWCLLWAPLACFATAEAVLAAVACLVVDWKKASWGVRIHAIAELCWLLGNAVWIVIEFLWDDLEGKPLPWYNGSILEPDDVKYHTGGIVMLAFWGLGLAALFGYYLIESLRYCDSKAKGRQYIMGSAAASSHPSTTSSDSSILSSSSASSAATIECDYGVGSINLGCCAMAFDLYSRLYIGPWIVKDIVWYKEMPIPTEICGFIVLVHLIDCTRRTRTLHFLSESIWVVGNMAWALNELSLHGSMAGGWISSGILATSLVIAFANLGCHRRREAKTEAPEEDSDGQGSSSSSVLVSA